MSIPLNVSCVSDNEESFKTFEGGKVSPSRNIAKFHSEARQQPESGDVISPGIARRPKSLGPVPGSGARRGHSARRHGAAVQEWLRRGR